MKIPADPSVPDHVDRVQAQWRAVRPDLDTSPIGIVARVGRLAAYFDEALDEILGEFGLSRSTWDILASLRRTGAPYELTPTELYRGLMRSSGWMTNRLHELESRGLVERHRRPEDGRGVHVRLTPTGLDLVDAIAPRHLANEERLLSALGPAERSSLIDLLRSMLRAREARESPQARVLQSDPRSGNNVAL